MDVRNKLPANTKGHALRWDAAFLFAGNLYDLCSYLLKSGDYLGNLADSRWILMLNLSKYLIDEAARFVFACLKDVGVCLCGDIYRGMTKAFGNKFEFFASLKEHGGVGVAHGVDGKAISEPLGVHVEVADGVRAHEAAMFVVDDEGITGAVSCETVYCLPCLFTAKYGHKLFPNRDSAETVRGFRCILDDKTTGCINNGLADR